MLLVTPFLKHVVYPSLARLGYFRKWRTKQPDQLTVLTYHGVFPEGYKARSRFLDGNLISKDRLREQLRILKCRYNVIAPEDFKRYLRGEFQLPSRAVMLTCDDGLANVVTDMLPVLQDEGLKCLFFLTGASFMDSPAMLWHEELWLLLNVIGPRCLDFHHASASIQRIPSQEQEKDRHALWWKLVHELSKTAAETREQFMDELRIAAGLSDTWKANLLQDEANRKRFQLLTVSQVADLLHAGMTIGAHTSHHPVLADCSAEVAKRELSAFAAADGKPLWAFAYPFGTEDTVSSRELALSEAAGYDCAFMNIGAGFSSAMHKFSIPRIHVTADMNLGEFEAHASAFHQYLQNKLRHSSLPTLHQPALQQR
jgi:peptidoglycan/xylan/chitin deacetylase (PgdA/CDA1 family)